MEERQRFTLVFDERPDFSVEVACPVLLRQAGSFETFRGDESVELLQVPAQSSSVREKREEGGSHLSART
jgi:hypothetical protein